MQALLRKIRQILKDRRTRRFFTRAVSSVAAIVVFVTTYALILPAITLEKTASCGIEEHQHSDSCYEAELVCGQEESDGHHHDGSCYSIKTELSCESREHQHSAEDGCYDADGNLVCELQEHVHDDSCYEEVRTLTCGLEESEGHHHTDTCYEKVLVCGKEVHTHNEKCYAEDGSNNGDTDANTGNTSDGMSSDQADTGDTAPEVYVPDATTEEAQPDSYVPELDPLDMEALLNGHTDFYYFHAEEEEEVPADSAEISDWRKVEEDTTLTSTDLVKVYLAYMIPAGSLNESNPVARYRLPENIHLTDDQIDTMNRYENGIAAGYRDSDASSGNYQKYLGAEAVEGDRRPDEELRDDAQEYISAVVRAENVYSDNGQYLGQDLIFTFVPYSIDKNRDTYDADQTLVSAGEKITGWFACDFRLDQIDWESETETANASTENTENAAGENITEENQTAKVIFAGEDQKEGIKEISRRLRLSGQNTKRASDEAQAETSEDTGKDGEDENDQIFKSGTLTAEGDDYKIILDYSEEAKIPENASLSVREITAETDKEAYEACLAQAGQQVAADDQTSVDQKASRFFDIEILATETDSDGTEKTVKIEPAAPVSVNIQINDTPAMQENKSEQSEPTVLHFAEEGVEQIDSTASTDSAKGHDSEGTNTEISFEAESFSIYGVVYTVDFHYEINGKLYEFSIPGGGFVSLEHLVEMLCIASVDENTESGAENIENDADAENVDDFVGEVPGADVNGENGEGSANATADGEASPSADSMTYEEAIKLNEVEVSEATKKFVADVESVEFSNSELVWVGKVDEATTVGGLKEANGLEVEYGADLTEEQTAEINSSTVEAGDWVLISIHPFTNEERLTITMKNGDQFVVNVTDAQISTHVITADGEDFLITVTYGSDAGIPDGAKLTARELLPGTEEYKTHYAQMINAVEGEVSDSDPDNGMNAEFAEVGLEVVDPQSMVDVSFARFFDISIWKDDVEIEPLAPVQVEIQYIDPIYANSDAEAEVIHFADDGIELIYPETDLNESSGEGISSFTYQQSSFSISATLLKYTTGIPNGNYVIIKGARVNNQDRYFALKADGSTVEVTKNGDTFTNNSNNADDAFWTFTSAGNGRYYIQNRSNGYSHLVLYNSIVGNWNQDIIVEAPDGRKTVYLRNPNNTPLRFNGNTLKFVLGAQNDNAEQFFLARMTSEVPQGQGYNLTPAGETDLGDLNAWKDKVQNSKIIVDKTASVVDYDNRMYQIDLKALSDITIIANKVDLELIVDTSRSMYFPANLSPLSNNYFTSIMGNDSHSLQRQLASLDTNQIYYFIGNGEQATVYALYYAASGTNLNDHTGDQCWKFVDASYMNPPDARSMNQSDRLNRLVGMRIDDLAYNVCNQNRVGGGCMLYTASSSITRLAYLKEAVRIASEIVYAVDRDNRIGLVTFNSSATNQGFFNYSNRNTLYSRINNISLAGGTRQDLGLETGKSQLDTNSRPDAEKIAILITDGAPNMRYDNNTQIPSDEAWRMIGEKATALKGTDSSNAKLYTLGLSLDMVGGNNQSHLNGLASEEDGVTRHFNASNGPDIVRAVKDLIDTLMYDVTLEAEVTDVLDPAFYPVDQNGNPIAAGDYTDDNGKRYNWSVVTVDGAQCWKITYYDQEVGRGEKNADNTIKTPGWQKSFYVKAKEDFLGGNNIETNRYKSSNNRVKPTKYVYTERGTNAVKKKDPPSNAPWGKFENTPTVNVDELHLTENSTEWTVYLGTEVKPEDQLRALWNNIKVKQVVKEGGTANDGTTITESGKKYYEKTDTADTESPTSGYASLPINRYFTDIDFEALQNQLKTVNSAERTVTYPGYGHNPGTITVKLEKTIISGAQDAVGKAPGQHTTDIVGTPAETYKITVTYNPQTDTVSAIGDSVTNSGEDVVKSENLHTINVIKKAIKIKKTDMVGTLLTDTAEFTLYRKAVNGDTNTVSLTNVTGLEDGNYVAVVQSTADGYATFDPVYPIKDVDGTYKQQTTDYWLVETNPPSTYTAMPGAVKVTLGLTETKNYKPAGQTNTGLYDWIQSATVLMEAVSGVADFYVAPTSTEAETIEFSIKNDKDTEITILKVDAMDNTKTLSGAKFKLIRNSQVVTDATITSLASGGGTISLDADSCFGVPKEGVKISGLKSGNYTLQEKASPAGYIITEQPLTFETGNGTVTNRSDGETDNMVEFRVPNTPGAALPHTGGTGTRLFTILGSILIFGAGGLLWRRRRLI